MNPSNSPVRRLYRSLDDRTVAGVAGGVAEYLKVDPIWIRLLFVTLTVLTGGAFALVYLAAWILVPEQKASSGTAPKPAPRFHRSAKERMVAGICGGLAETFKVDPALVRLAAVAAIVFSWGGALLAYLIAWIVLPLEPAAPLVLPPGEAPTGESHDPVVEASSRPVE